MTEIQQQKLGPEWNIKVQCLCCNAEVLARYQDWGPTIAIVCLHCLNSVPLQVMRSVFILRSQNNFLNNAVNDLRTRMDKMEFEEITPEEAG